MGSTRRMAGSPHLAPSLAFEVWHKCILHGQGRARQVSSRTGQTSGAASAARPCSPHLNSCKFLLSALRHAIVLPVRSADPANPRWVCALLPVCWAVLMKSGMHRPCARRLLM